MNKENKVYGGEISETARTTMTNYCRALSIAGTYAALYTPEELKRLLIGRGVDVTDIDVNLLHYTALRQPEFELGEKSGFGRTGRISSVGTLNAAADEINKKLSMAVAEAASMLKGHDLTEKEVQEALKERGHDISDKLMPSLYISAKTLSQCQPVDYPTYSMGTSRASQEHIDLRQKLRDFMKDKDIKFITSRSIDLDGCVVTEPMYLHAGGVTLEQDSDLLINFQPVEKENNPYDQVFRIEKHRGESISISRGMTPVNPRLDLMDPHRFTDLHIGSFDRAKPTTQGTTLRELSNNPFLFWPKSVLLGGDFEGNVAWPWDEKAKRLKNKRRRKNRKENRRGKQWRR